MFYSPCLVWRLLYDKSGKELEAQKFLNLGIRLKDIVLFANDRSNIQPSKSL